MKVKDCSVSFEFDDGTFTGIFVKGFTEEFINTETGERSFRVVSGKEKFLQDAETKTFVDLGNLARRYKDIKSMLFIEEEREI